MLLAAALLTLAAEPPRPETSVPTLLALPVAPGIPGQGPWTIEIWPYEGCKTCSVSQGDQNAFEAARDILLRRKSGPLGSATSITILSLNGGQREENATPEALLQAIKGCALGSEGPLQPNPHASGTAFGIGIDCPGRSKRSFLSLVFDEQKLVRVYYLPDEPIWVLNGL